MNKVILLTGLFLSYIGIVSAQVDEKLKADIRNTGYIHTPLPLDYGKSFETPG